MAIQFQPPPDWLIQDYMNRKSDTVQALEGVAGVAQIYMQEKARRDNLALKQQEAGRQNQELAMQGREQFYNYGDVASLPPEQQQAIGSPAQGPVTEQGVGPMKSPIIQHYESFLQENKNGIKGRPQMGMNSLLMTPEQNNASFSGDPSQLNAAFPGGVPIQAARIAATAKGQGAVQDRFSNKFEQAKAEKGATAEMKTGESLRQVQEAKNLLDQLTTIHAQIVDKKKGGNPLTATVVGGVAKATGGGFGTDDVLAYNTAVDGMLTRLKSVTGNTGVVTEFDQKRMEALAPRLGENKETVARKNKIIKDIFDLTAQGEYQKLDNYLTRIGVKQSGGVSKTSKSPQVQFDDEEEKEYQAWKASQ